MRLLQVHCLLRKLSKIRLSRQLMSLLHEWSSQFKNGDAHQLLAHETEVLSSLGSQGFGWTMWARHRP